MFPSTVVYRFWCRDIAIVPRNANSFHLGRPTLSEAGFAVALEVTGGLPMKHKPEKPHAPMA